MLKVLILDDDQLFNRTLSRVLERDESLGCVVTTATDDSGACEAVCGADPPFDVFLIDQRLGAGRDGIDVLEELQQRSPSSQAIIFTEAGNEESGLRAYLAGAYRYLHKPFKHEELVLVLKSLWAMIQVQRERDWLRVHAEIAEASQRPLSVEEMGQVVVESAQRLGFERSRLWLLTPDGDALLGANQAGNYGLEHFKECRIGTDEVPYMTEVLAKHEPYLFNGDAYGQSYLSQRYGDAGYEDATDGWVGLPLWSEDRSMGVLHLDNLVQPRQVRREEFSQLALFGKLAAAALERAQLYEQERRKSREVELLATIGRHISDRAAVVSNKELIVEIYHLVGQLIDVSSFFLALYNDRTDVIDLAVDYLNREFVKPHSFRYGTGLTSYVIKSSAPLLLTTEAEIRTFRREHHIRKKGPTARCWLGVPLTVEQRTFGVMVVQSITHEHVFTQYHKLLLGAIADQVAGAIQASWLREAERSNMGRLSVLQRVSEELLRRALLDEGQMWHIVLTAATAEYGLRFNRAMLFLLDPSGATLVGEHGIGHLDSREARWSWRSDIRQKVTLDTYLEQLNHYRLLSTPVDTIIRDLRIEIRNNGRIFTEVMRDHVWRSVPAEQAAMHMPPPFVEQLGSAEYAVLPIIAAERSIGLLVVDNAFNHVPLSTMPLSELERLLSQAALVHENLVQRRASLSLLEVSKQMLSRVAEQPLQKTLSQICEVARALTGASCVTILPLMAGAGSHQLSFEIAQIGSTGLQHLEQRLSLNLALLSTLREGNYIAIPDIRIATLDVATDAFFSREGILASIIVPIIDHEEDLLAGAFELHYRTARRFDNEDVRQALSLAELAGAVIHGTEAHRRAKQNELRTQAELLKKALAIIPDAPDAERELVTAVIWAVSELISQPETRVGILMRSWKEPHEAQMAQEFRRQYFLVDGEIKLTTEDRIDRGITGLVFKDGVPRQISDVRQLPWAQIFYPAYPSDERTRSELDVPILLDGQILGVINVESASVGAYNEEHQSTVERLAATAALALGNLRRQQNLRKVMDAAKVVVAPADLDLTLAALIEAARQVAPGVGAITLWYRDPERKHVMLYARHVGVAQPELLSSGPADAQSPVLKVMEHSTPLFVVDLYAHPILGGDFIVHEQIVSVAALPLVADDETVGALFFNYRARHTFTSEECALFQTMAAVAAASVRDALRLEALKRERQRLERERQRLDVARRITEAIGTTIDLNQTQIKVLGTLREIFEEAQICLMLYDTEEQALRFAPTSHQYYNFELIDPLQPLRVFAEQGIVCRVARITLKSKRAEVENIGNVAADPNYLKANRSTQSQLCVSLVSVDQGDLLGLLVLESTSPDAFSDDDKALVWAAAQSIAIAIERANQSSRLRFKASVADATVWIHEFRHNINSAISIIRGQAYLVQPVVPVAYQLHLEKIVAQAEQINAYLRASGAQGKLALSLDEWLAAQLVATKLPSRISRHCVSGCPGVHVEVVPLLLERVLHHLLRNVVESTSGAVDLTLTSERLSQYARVRVHNTGPDLDPAILSRLWIEPVSTKSNQRQGIEGGLGLLFVRSSVEMMGGTVNLLRSHGQGVTFTFTLPIVRQTTLEEV